MWLRLKLHKFLNPLELQVEEYLKWKGQRSAHKASGDKDVLYLFLRKTHRQSIEDLTETDIIEFLDHLRNTIYSTYYHQSAVTSLRCFLRFHRARKKNCILLDDMTIRTPKTISTKKFGRPAKLKLIRQVQALYKKGLTIQQISDLPEIDRYPSQIHRWLKYPLS